MPERISLMLESMITAIEDGFSYDGIVSIPETGLEDVRGFQPSPTDRLRDRVDRLREAISKAVNNVLRPENDNLSPTDSGFGSNDKEKMPRKRELVLESSRNSNVDLNVPTKSVVRDEVTKGGEARLRPGIQERMPILRSGRALEDIAHPSVGQNLMRMDEEAIPHTDIDQSSTARVREPRRRTTRR